MLSRRFSWAEPVPAPFSLLARRPPGRIGRSFSPPSVDIPPRIPFFLPPFRVPSHRRVALSWPLIGEPHALRSCMMSARGAS